MHHLTFGPFPLAFSKRATALLSWGWFSIATEQQLWCVGSSFRGIICLLAQWNLAAETDAGALNRLRLPLLLFAVIWQLQRWIAM